MMDWILRRALIGEEDPLHKQEVIILSVDPLSC